MSYYGYCNFNSIEELVLDDLRVRKNRKQVYQFGKLIVLKSNRKTRRLIQKLGVVGKKVKTKGKRVSAYLVLSYTLSSPTYIIFSAASQNVLPFPNHGASIHKLRQRIEEINEINHKKSLSQIAILKELKFNKIVFTPQQYNEANQLFEQVRSGTLSMSDVALQIRGGDMQSIIGILVTILILNNIWTRICNSPEARNFLDSAEAFLQKPNQGRFPPKNDLASFIENLDGSKKKPSRPERIGMQPSAHPSTALGIERPPSMPHLEFVGLTKEERRAVPHNNDIKIMYNGIELEIGYWQSLYKVGDHGAIHGLPYIVRDNGETKTEKSEENALAMMQSIADLPNKPNVKVFENGMYQGGTNRAFEAIHIYDTDTRIIAVFKKSTGKFVTTCQLETDERDELFEPGHNFGGGKGWFSGLVRNKPPQHIINTFESDVMGITPIESETSSLPNPGFTPIDSFENDVMEITPVNPENLDNNL